MPLPPEQIPEGLSSREYMQLFRTYSLMGRRTLAFQALTLASNTEQADAQAKSTVASEASTAAGNQEIPDAEKLTAGINLIQALFQLASGVDENGNPVDPAELKAKIKRQMIGSGLSDQEAESSLEKLTTTLNNFQAESHPPREVPEGLTATEYLELGKRYKLVGWTEQARDALNNAIGLDPDGNIGKRSLSYLRSKLPRHPIPLFAEQGNIEGYNLMVGGNLKGAQEAFEKLIANYPDFEWPLSNLGTIMIETGNFERARELLQKALMINAFYVNAWLHLGRLSAVEGKFREAYDAFDRAESIDPEEEGIQPLRKLVRELEAG